MTKFKLSLSSLSSDASAFVRDEAVFREAAAMLLAVGDAPMPPLKSQDPLRTSPQPVSQSLDGSAEDQSDAPRLQMIDITADQDDANRYQQQADLEQIDPATAAGDLAQSRLDSVAVEDLPIGKHRRHAGEHHKNLGCVTEAKVVHCDLVKPLDGM